MSAILHYISLLTLVPKSYFKINTFQPNFLCSSSFNIYFIKIHSLSESVVYFIAVYYGNNIKLSLSVHEYTSEYSFCCTYTLFKKTIFKTRIKDKQNNEKFSPQN